MDGTAHLRDVVVPARHQRAPHEYRLADRLLAAGRPPRSALARGAQGGPRTCRASRGVAIVRGVVMVFQVVRGVVNWVLGSS